MDAKPLILMGRSSATGLEVTPLSQIEQDLFDAEWDFLLKQMEDIDPQVAASYRRNYNAYVWMIGQAKNAFNNNGYAGLRPASGSFGIRLFTPQDLGTAFASGANPKTSNNHTFRQAVVLAANHADAILWNISAFDNTQGQQSIHGFHGLLSYTPGTRLTAYVLTVNGLPYQVWGVDPFAKLQKALKPFRIIPLMLDNRSQGGICYPGLSGSWEVTGTWDVEDIAIATGQTIIEEIAPTGLVVAQFTYLNSQFV